MANADDALWWLESYGVESQVAEHRHVWLWAEAEGDRVSPTSQRLLGVARDLADTLGVRAEAVLASSYVSDKAATELLALGADVVYVADGQPPSDYPAPVWAAWLSSLAQQQRPEVLLLADTETAQEIAPRVAQRLGVGLVTGCVGLAVDASERALTATRYGFAGRSLITTVFGEARPQMAIVRTQGLRSPEPELGRSGLIQQLRLPSENITQPLATFVPGARRNNDLTSASVVVVGGEEMRGPEGFTGLEELAHRLGGVLGASRTAVDRGWMPKDRLVDYLGHHIHPELCLVCGVREGADHLASVRQSGLVIAITRDPSAPILSIADFRILDDPVKVVEALNAELRASKSAAKGGEAHGRQSNTARV